MTSFAFQCPCPANCEMNKQNEHNGACHAPRPRELPRARPLINTNFLEIPRRRSCVVDVTAGTASKMLLEYHVLLKRAVCANHARCGCRNCSEKTETNLESSKWGSQALTQDKTSRLVALTESFSPRLDDSLFRSFSIYTLRLRVTRPMLLQPLHLRQQRNHALPR